MLKIGKRKRSTLSEGIGKASVYTWMQDASGISFLPKNHTCIANTEIWRI